MASVAPDKILEIKQLISNHLSQSDINSALRDVLSDYSQRHPNSGPISRDHLIGELKNRGVVDSMMQNIQFGNQQPSPRQRQSLPMTSKPTASTVDTDQLVSVPLEQVNFDANRRHLYLQFLNGKAFTDYLNEPQSENYPGYSSSSLASSFSISILFRNQRFRTRPFACAGEPYINQGFLLELHKDKQQGEYGAMADTQTLLSICDRIHIVLTRKDTLGEIHLVSSHFLEWRQVLCAQASKTNRILEINGIGAENKLPVGVINVCLQLIPPLNESVSNDILAAQLDLEHTKSTERERLFLIYAKQWWKEFLEIREEHRTRLVKIFGQDENGVNHPVFTFVQPLRSGRLLDTPREAARFVSLIGYDRHSVVGNTDRTEMWTHAHAFLARNCGDCENHAVLLCSLLLGFGLDAYVCIGTKGKNQIHSWVVTIGADDVFFWESLNGNRYQHTSIDPDDPPLDKLSLNNIRHPYKTIGCLFNDKSFYANIQPTCNVDACVFRLTDQSKWKAMSVDAIASINTPGLVLTAPVTPHLMSNTLDPVALSNDIEKQIRALIIQHRKDLGYTTQFDDHLSYLLSPALSSYELERVTGLSVGNEEFQEAVRRAVPNGHAFKGFPIQFVHKNARKAFVFSLRNNLCEEIVCCHGDQVRLAVRVRVFTYPENAIATWMMFACRYKSVGSTK
ncbi:unnamed protein product [Adineta steineri]|uniref:Centrosomal protein of 76 kDa n=1 Tax=Adineta steineri TaxID=433720 RepID=A0A819I5A7_9BILA|nr:unnamed protein product [Adineta steineri]CAF3910845.1 unnamed protein product [Adineta steineri]